MKLEIPKVVIGQRVTFDKGLDLCDSSSTCILRIIQANLIRLPHQVTSFTFQLNRSIIGQGLLGTHFYQKQ